MRTATQADQQQATMQAIVQDDYGAAEDVLRLEEIDRPAIADTEVLLRVHAAGVDRGVWHLMTGLPFPVRLAGYGIRAPKTRVRGREVAGRVEAVGSAVTTLAIGDEVFGIAEGAFADYACAQPGKLALRPANLPAEQAAAVAVSALTALQGIRDWATSKRPASLVSAPLVASGRSRADRKVRRRSLVYPRRPRWTCSDPRRCHVIDYTRDEIGAGGRRYDVIIDIGGSRPLRQLRSALAPRGTLVIVGGETDGRWLGGFDRSLRAPVLSLLVRQKLGGVMCSENAADLLVLAALIESGKVRPVIDRTYPLSQTAAAVRYVQEGMARGKVVITLQA